MIEYQQVDKEWFNREVPHVPLGRELAEKRLNAAIAQKDDCHKHDLAAAYGSIQYWEREYQAERVKRQAVEYSAEQFKSKVKLWVIITGSFVVLCMLILARGIK